MAAFKPKILCIAGSLRKGSFNKKLVRVAMEYATEAGANATYADLRDYPMPVYDEDIETEQGIPQAVVDFQCLLKQQHGLLIASPVYLGTIPGALKNAIDWATRTAPGVGSSVCFDGKVAGLLAASPGSYGGAHVLTPLRGLLSNVGMLVVAEQFSLPLAHSAFNDDGTIKDLKHQSRVRAVADRVVDVTRRLHGRKRASKMRSETPRG